MTGYKQGCNTDGELIRDFYVEHDPVDLACPDDGMTRQEFKDECDINVLMATYQRNGALNHFNRLVPEYLDVSNVPDLMTSLDYFDRAQTAFMTLPAATRAEFDNDPLRFVEFAQQESNLPRMREWGLAAPEKPVQPVSSSEPTPPSGVAAKPASSGS